MLKNMAPITVDAEITNSKGDPSRVSLSFAASPPPDAIRFLNGLRENETPADFLAAMAADDETRKLASLVPEAALLVAVLQAKYRTRLAEVTAMLAPDTPKS